VIGKYARPHPERAERAWMTWRLASIASGFAPEPDWNRAEAVAARRRPPRALLTARQQFSALFGPDGLGILGRQRWSRNSWATRRGTQLTTNLIPLRAIRSPLRCAESGPASGCADASAKRCGRSLGPGRWPDSAPLVHHGL